METISAEIFAYIQEHTLVDDPLLREMEQRGQRDHFPIIGPLVGPWLYFLARSINAERIFEMGSGFGYSTWFFAKALADQGRGCVKHTVWDKDLSDEAKQWLDRAGLAVYCDFEVSESILALEASEAGHDLIFMDIDKEAYLDAVPVIESKLRPGGLLLVDNILWGGMVVHGDDRSTAGTAIRAFNDHLRDSRRWNYLIAPLRDGLGIARFNG
jgi:caffeoyl-CoA O-methyltransferase